MKKTASEVIPVTFPNQERQRLCEILISGADLLVDDQLADRILKTCPYKGQRPINDDRALLLSDTMERGTFLPNTQIAFGCLNGNYYLVNGQHRLTAVTLSRQSQHFRIEVYECTAADDLDALYSRFDQPGGQRTLTQISRSLGLHDDEAGLRPATAALLLRAVPLLMMDFKRIVPAQRPRNTRDMDEKKAFALRWKSQAIDYQTCLDAGVGSRTARYRSAGVMAVALATLRHQHAKAKEFWMESIRDSGLREGDARHTLHLYFLQVTRRRNEFDLAEASSLAWNAWFAGRSWTLVKLYGNEIKLRGTPIGD